MAKPEIPILQRQVTIQQTSTPEMQSAFNALAESQNSLSAIGAKVAQSASNHMAMQLGYESGKNPHGDLLPSITEFDKNFADTYYTQANATLTVQANKLMTDAQLQMSQARRLTPELIDRTNQQLQLGLSQIAQQAPTAIKGSLEANFANQLINQNARYQEKMVGEQREDQRNNLINGIQVNTQNALEFATNGDLKAAGNLVETTRKMAESAVRDRSMTPEQARVAVQTAEQAALDGHYSNLAIQAEKEGKYPEFARNYAEKKIPGTEKLTNEQFVNSGNAFQRQINFRQGLRAQDENLKVQQMENAIAMDVNAITGVQFKAFEDSVSAQRFQEVKFKYIQALKANQARGVETDGLIQNFSSPEAWANATEKTKNQAYNKAVNYAVEQSNRENKPISHEAAQVQVAASAGGTIPAFINELKNKLNSANPAYIESAAQQIHGLQAMGAGHALSGLNDHDKALYTAYESLRDSMDPTTAAREATNLVLNQDPAVQQMNKQKWSNFVTTSTSGGIQLDDFALKSVGLNKSDFITSSMGQVYGTNILQKYATYYQLLNGDQKSALKLTKQFVNENYGDTGVNGDSYKTLHPLEMVLGFKDSSGVPYIQQDVINQVNQKLIPIKKAYEEKKVNEYWETVPLTGKQKGYISPHHDIIFGKSKKYDPIKIKRHLRTANGEKIDTFNLVLQGNAFDNWDVAIETGSGMRNLFQIAPYLGVISYVPNKKSIMENYNKDHSLK